MVLLYRFHDMDSMRDPHIYCNQHSDQNKVCAINMVAMPLWMGRSAVAALAAGSGHSFRSGQ